MGSDSKLYVRIDEDQADALRSAIADERCAAERNGAWLALTPADRGVGEALSRRLGVVAVFWDINTTVDQIWLTCLQRGRVVRELRYTADDGWATNRGKPMPFENTRALERWLARNDLLASPDGYAVLEAFLGLEAAAPAAKAAPIIDERANTKFELAASLVADLRARAARLGVDASLVVHTAWECSKHALYEREAARQAPAREVTLAPSSPPRPLAAEAADLPELKLKGYPLTCEFRLPAEVTAELLNMKLAFDRKAAWLLTEAYLLARARLG
jgi:hypothetical protein